VHAGADELAQQAEQAGRGGDDQPIIGVVVQAPLQPGGELAGEAVDLQLLASIGLVLGLGFVQGARVGVVRLVEQLPGHGPALLVLELLPQVPHLRALVRREELGPAPIGHQYPQRVRHRSSS
jgi:hypothetical protein